jgi:transposase
VSRDVTSDEAWVVIGPLFPAVKATGRQQLERRTVAEATAWRVRTGALWGDVPERLGNWKTVYRDFDRWAKAGMWAQVLERVQSLADADGELDWVVSVDSMIARVHRHGATLPRRTGASPHCENPTGPELSDHGMGRSRDVSATKVHLIPDRPSPGLGRSTHHASKEPAAA